MPDTEMIPGGMPPPPAVPGLDVLTQLTGAMGMLDPAVAGEVLQKSGRIMAAWPELQKILLVLDASVAEYDQLVEANRMAEAQQTAGAVTRLGLALGRRLRSSGTIDFIREPSKVLSLGSLLTGA